MRILGKSVPIGYLLAIIFLILASPTEASPVQPEWPGVLTQMLAKAYAEDWIVFGGGLHQTYMYVPRTLKSTPKGTKTVWAVNIQDDDEDSYSGRHAVLENRRRSGVSTEGYDKYYYSKVKWECDCVHELVRIVEVIDYDEDNNVIKSGTLDGKLEEPPPDSNGEGLIRSVCNPTMRRHFRRMYDEKKETSDGH